MRGKVFASKSKRDGFRITPAYAGKSGYRNLVAVDTGDHPRLCGEKFRIHSFITCQPGSPPPMRGKGFSGIAFAVLVGITPAYAGKSVIFKIV